VADVRISAADAGNRGGVGRSARLACLDDLYALLGREQGKPAR
jgi:hypothetical protein